MGVHQGADEAATDGADAVQVDGKASGAFPYGRIDHDVAEPGDGMVVHITGDGDHGVPPRHLRGDRRRPGGRGKAPGLAVELLPQRFERPPEQPRDVHLRHADLGCDLMLARPAEEVAVQDVPLPVGQPVHQAAHRQTVGRRGERGIFAAEEVQAFGALLARRHRRVERVAVVSVAGRPRLMHVRRTDLQLGGEILHGRRALEPLDQCHSGPGQLEMPLLQATVDVDGPPVVAEVFPDLAQHRGNEIGEERPADVSVVSVDRLDQGHRRDLSQVFAGLPPVAVAIRQAGRERQIDLDYSGPESVRLGGLAAVVQRGEQLSGRHLRGINGDPFRLPDGIVGGHKSPRTASRGATVLASPARAAPCRRSQ